jgi:hypothetical protein
MEKPASVHQAVIGIWATIILSAIAILITKRIGDISIDEFLFKIIIIVLISILPYKINQGSNAARYIYLVFFAISILLMLAGRGNEMPRTDLILLILLVPVELFIIYKLYQPESSVWFVKR